MVVLAKPPSKDLIGLLAGIVDFYDWKGIHVARRWPRKPSMPRAPAVQVSANLFGYFATELTNTPPNIRARATVLAIGTAWTWRDLRYRAIYGHLIDT